MKKKKSIFSIFICIVCSILYLYLSYKSLVLIPQLQEEIEPPIMNSSNIIEVLIISVIYLVCIIALTKILSNKKGISKWLLFAVMLWVVIISIIFISSSGLKINSDQEDIYFRACDMKNGNYESMTGLYFNMFPYQLGLMLYEKLLITCKMNVDIIILGVLNSIYSSIIIFSGYKIIKKITESESVLITYLLLMASNIVLIMYSGFLYNDIISIMFSLLSVWMFLEYLQKERLLFFILNILFISLACIFRLTSFIVLIAEVCVLVYKIISKKKIKLLINAFILIIIPLILSKAPVLYCNSVYGGNIKEGAPMNLTIAMGMQNDEYPGWYNDYNYSTYVYGANRDAIKAKETANEYIINRINYFMTNINEALNFYDRKISFQWADGTYESFTVTYNSNTEKGIVGNLLFYGNSHKLLEKFMDAYQFLVYVMSFVFVISRLFTNKENDTNDGHLLLNIAVIGGFLFSIIWETKGRYILPYYFVLIIIASLGINLFNTNINHYLNKYNKK